MNKHKLVHSSSGYLYAMTGVRLLCNDDELYYSRRVMPLYQRIADECGVKPTCVIKGLRTTLAGSTFDLSTGEFLFYAADELRCGANKD